MIEIKYVDGNGDKHYSLFSNEKASSIADAAGLILSEPEFTEATGIFDLKEGDIVDVFGVEESNKTNKGAFYKCVLKYVSEVTNKPVKYTILVFANDIEDAHSQIPDIIAQTLMRNDVEVVKIEQSAFTDVIC